MVQVLVEPGAQDVGDRLGQVPSAALIPRVDRVANDAEIRRRSRVRETLGRGLLGIALVGHGRVRGIVHHGPCWAGVVGRGVGVAGAHGGRGAQVVAGVGIGAREGGVGRVQAAVWQGLQVADRGQDGAGPAGGVGGRGARGVREPRVSRVRRYRVLARGFGHGQFGRRAVRSLGHQPVVGGQVEAGRGRTFVRLLPRREV